MSIKTKYGGRAHPKRQIFRRRTLLSNRRRQIAATLKVAGWAFVLLLAINALIAWQAYTVTTQIMATDPDIGERLAAASYQNIGILGGLSLIVFVAVIVRSIVLTHRTYGGIRKIVQGMETVSEGQFNVEIKLRSQDSIKAFEEPFNEMTLMLKLQALEDQKAMQKLAAEIEGHGNPVDAEMLRRLADAKGRAAE